jgi:hypothetical protein
MSQPDSTKPERDPTPDQGRRWTFESGLLATIGMIVLIPGLIWLVMGIGVAAVFSLGGVPGFIMGLGFVLPPLFITGLGGALIYGALKLRHPFEIPRGYD